MVIDITDIEMPLEAVIKKVSEFRDLLGKIMDRYEKKDETLDMDLIINLRNNGTRLILIIEILKGEYALAQMQNEAPGEGYKILMQKFQQFINILTGISNALEINCSSLLIMSKGIDYYSSETV